MIKRIPQPELDASRVAVSRPRRARNLRSLALLACLAVAASGCQTAGTQQEVRRIDPVLSQSISRAELVEYLNRQNHGLDGWRCMSTRLTVRLPRLPPQPLSGHIACQSPQYFRLTADNMIAKADLGSNASHCWVYAKPGESAVMMWKHEDTSLLQQMPGGVPYIDSNWLMLVLGISPLDANDYELSRAPNGRQELWLTAIEQSATGRPLRRVVKVDAVNGVIREHAVYDSEANPLVRAQLSRHQRSDGYLIPSAVKLVFPQMDSELELSFRSIETNPSLPDHLWHMPDKNIPVVDIGQMVRDRMLVQNNSDPHALIQQNAPRATLQPPIFHQPEQHAFHGQSESMLDGAVPNNTSPDIEEPDWDAPIASGDPKTQQISLTNSIDSKPEKKRSFFSKLLFGR